MRVLTWNLFHGRAQPAAGRPLAAEFAAALAGWDWDVALLQEVPPWWPGPLARAAGAQARRALTSRNRLLPPRRAIARRNPDLLKSWGGGCNAILVRPRRDVREQRAGGPVRPPEGAGVREHRVVELTRRPERRVAHAVALEDGSWVVNLHATTEPKARTRADCALALGSARAWAGSAPLVFGGDFNLDHPAWPGLVDAAGHHVDHILCSGWVPAAPQVLLDAGTLSDHRPLLVELGR